MKHHLVNNSLDLGSVKGPKAKRMQIYVQSLPFFLYCDIIKRGRKTFVLLHALELFLCATTWAWRLWVMSYLMRFIVAIHRAESPSSSFNIKQVVPSICCHPVLRQIKGNDNSYDEGISRCQLSEAAFLPSPFEGFNNLRRRRRYHVPHHHKS